MAKKIYLSPSNQNGNLYSYGDTNEMEQCNRIAQAAEKHLERNGYTVKRAPKGQDMNKSIAESNSWGADLHIPIHTNAGGGSGPLVMVYNKASGNVKYAQPIYDALLAICTGKKGYGVRIGTEMTSGNYMPAELSDTVAVAAYCECEFHDDKTLAKWIINHVDDIGAAIAKGVCKADGKTYIEEEAETPDVFYRVQVGAFNEKSNADNLAKKLEKAGYDALVVTVKQDSKVFYRVQVGAFNEKANADALAKRLENDGYDAIVVEVKR